MLNYQNQGHPEGMNITIWRSVSILTEHIILELTLCSLNQKKNKGLTTRVAIKLFL